MPDNDPKTLIIERLTRENEQLKLLVASDGKVEERLTIVSLLRQIDQLKRERADLCSQVEIEEESIINALQRRLDQLQKEKVDLENALEQEQEFIVNKLQRQLEEISSSSTEHPKKQQQQQGIYEQLHFRPSESHSLADLVRTTERERELHRTIRQLQQENQHLLSENLRLSQRLRRTSIDELDDPIGPLTAAGGGGGALSLRRSDSANSDASSTGGRKFGSLADLRTIKNQ